MTSAFVITKVMNPRRLVHESLRVAVNSLHAVSSLYGHCIGADVDQDFNILPSCGDGA